MPLNTLTTMPLGGIFSLLKDASEILGIAALVYKGVICLHQATQTFIALPKFMDSTTTGIELIRNHAETAVTNHLTHMEQGISSLAQTTERFADSVEGMQRDFQKHVIEISKTQAVILDRVPQI